ncbi:DUF4129 domain-containing protein [Candidatus Gracilibacteria bacterium]|nr:DUF4129 domain-containing protein [Candidatus Gracilibacteria bacterium]
MPPTRCARAWPTPGLRSTFLVTAGSASSPRLPIIRACPRAAERGFRCGSWRRRSWPWDRRWSRSRPFGRSRRCDQSAQPTVATRARDGCRARPDLRGPLTILAWIASLALGLLGLAYARYRLELRGLSGVAADYASTGLLARWAGLQHEPHLTPDEYAAQLGAVLPQYRRTLQHLAHAYNAERYAGKHIQSANPDEVKELRWTLVQRIGARLIGRA